MDTLLNGQDEYYLRMQYFCSSIILLLKPNSHSGKLYHIRHK